MQLPSRAPPPAQRSLRIAFAADYDLGVYSSTNLTVNNNAANSFQFTSDTSTDGHNTFTENIVRSDVDIADSHAFTLTNNSGASITRHMRSLSQWLR